MGTRVISMNLANLPDAIKGANQAVLNAIFHGSISGAQRARSYLTKRTPTDQGQLRASWKVKAGPVPVAGASGGGERTMAELKNDAPHAATVELGARPHPVSEEGIEAIARWVMRNHPEASSRVVASGPIQRKSGGRTRLNRDTRYAIALSIARAIAWKILHEGQRPTYFVRDSLPAVRQMVAAEINHYLDSMKPPRAARGKGGA